MKPTSSAGKLYLIPVPLGDENRDVLPQSVKAIAHNLKHFVVEKEKTARRILKAIGYPHPFDEVEMVELNHRTSIESILPVISLMKTGVSFGLMSEAGAPGIADPGEKLVELAHQHDLRVVPLVGPSSIMLALMASGMNANNFAYRGYLPVKPHERKKRLVELERHSRKNDEAQIFIETPYRNMQLFEEILKTCLDDTLLCIAREITQSGEFIKTLPVKSWHKMKVSLQNRPAVFILSAR